MGENFMVKVSSCVYVCGLVSGLWELGVEIENEVTEEAGLNWTGVKGGGWSERRAGLDGYVLRNNDHGCIMYYCS